MSIGYTSLLALVQPVDGTEVGTWGDDVNNGVSSILDVAVAGTQNITTDANVTLTITQATSSGTNLSSTSAQYAILLLSGARTATRTITLPASSKTYTVMNSTTGGYAQTVGGLTIAVGEYCTIAYNTSSSSWVKTSTQSGAGVFSTVTATVAYQGDFSNSTLLSRTLFTTTTANSTTGIYAVPSGTATAASWQATNAADPTNASKILIATNGSTDVQLVSGRNGTGTYLPLSFYTNGSQQAQLTVAGVWTTVNDASIHGLTVGLGGGSDVYSTAVGVSALTSSSGSFNTAVGWEAGYTNTSGARNVFIGRSAGQLNTSGSYLTAVGESALYANTTANYNTAIGNSSLNANTTGAANTAIGVQSLQSNTTASNNTAVGYQAGYTNTTASNNTAGGSQAMYYNTTGASNAAWGQGALFNNTTGNFNVGIGANALLSNTTANRNAAVGYQSMYTNSTGAENAALGHSSLYYNTTGSYNVAVGGGALQNNITTSGLTAVGYQSQYTNNGGGNNASFGYQSLYLNTVGANNTAIGTYALQYNTTGNYNTSVGYAALVSNTTAITNTAVGYQAAYSNTTGNYNSALGYTALYSNTTGERNVAIGHTTLNANTTGYYNTAVGMYALASNTTASNNTAVGYQAGYSQTIGTQNVYLGTGAGYSDTGVGSVFIGYQSGYTSNAGANVSNGTVAIGYKAGYSLTTGIQNTFVGPASSSTGYGAGYFVTSGSNNTIIGQYTGNNGGIDIRTSSGNLVLSSGAGTPLVWYVGGGIYNANNTTTWNTTSDARVKKNVVPLAKGLDVINALNPVEFDYIIGGKHDVAFLAQEYEKVLPEQVSETTDITDEIKALTNGEPLKQLQQNLVPYLVKAVQELSAQVAQLQSQLKGN